MEEKRHMRQGRLRRGLALGLAAALALTQGASASQALGTEIHTVILPLAQGVEMTKQNLWSATYSDLRTEHFMTYTPSEGVRPVVAYGEKITARATLSEMAKNLEAQGKRVLGGVNGDYYVLATGAPLGMVISEGVLRSTPQYSNSWSLGFLPDGTAFIGQPELTVTANFLGHTLAVSGGINKVRTQTGGYYLLTEEFGTNTMNTEPGVDVILRPLEEGMGERVQVDLTVTQEEPGDTTGQELPSNGEAEQEPGTEQPEQKEQEGQEGEDPVTDSAELDTEDTAPAPPPEEEAPERITATLTRSRELRVGSRVTCEVMEVLQSQGAIQIPQGCYVLTINGKSNEWLVERLAALTPGERVELDLVSRDSRWNEAETAVGGMYKLVTGGVVEEGLDTERAPRSAVGVRPDGSTVFYTIDGRQAGYSVGATLTQVAQRLVELGCVEAVCLDGGGSTTFGATLPDGSAMTVTNKPSGGKERANSNALFLVSSKKPTGVLERFCVTPYDSILLSGTSVQMDVVGIDSNGFPMPWSGELSWSIHDGDGQVTTEGLFTAGGGSAVTTVTAESGDRRASGTASLTVVRTPDVIRLWDGATGAAVTGLNLEPGQVVDLTATAVYRNLTLGSQDTSYTWTMDPAVGTVDEQGVVTAGPASGKGSLTVSAGERSLMVPVSVTGHILPLEDFEGELTALTSTEKVTVEKETDLERVRFGRGSARVSYDISDGAAALAASLPIRAGERFLSLWVYGDGSGNILMASAVDAQGTVSDVLLTGLDFTGWRRVMVRLPEGATELQALRVEGGGEIVSGILWLDQLTTANEQVVDTEAPIISLEVGTDGLSAVVTDAMDQALTEKNLTLTLDGIPLDFTWDPASARMRAALPVGDGRLHRITVTAHDASGNLARANYSYSSVEEWTEPFEDMEGHWGQGYTAYLYQQGVTNGITTQTGLAFQPEKDISRGEFALMVARWQGLDLETYAEGELPFADLAEIPDWMLPAVRAMYDQGIMKGSLEGETLYAHAQRGISRAEAMTILGRIQVKGYPLSELGFDDADQVPSWALDHVQTLVAQGVVGGYENQLHPTSQVKRGEVAKMLVSLM